MCQMRLFSELHRFAQDGLESEDQSKMKAHNQAYQSLSLNELKESAPAKAANQGLLCLYE